VTRNEELRLSLSPHNAAANQTHASEVGCKDTRGSPCQAPAVSNKVNDRPVNGRCKLHGGLSTGPKTQEGKCRSAQAARAGLKRYWAQRRQREDASKQPTRVVGLAQGGKFNG